MDELLEPAQDAIFAALVAIEGMDGLPDDLVVLQHVPEETPESPYRNKIVIGQLSNENADDKGAMVEEITAEVHYVFRGTARAPLLAMMKAGRRTLHGQVLSADGAVFTKPRWIAGEASNALADGVTYVGLQVFKFYAQPADAGTQP